MMVTDAKGGSNMNMNKFQKIKIEKEKKYLVHYRSILGDLCWFYERGKDIMKSKKHIKLKTWMLKKINHRKVIEIEEA